jgi:hypothetical protein
MFSAFCGWTGCSWLVWRLWRTDAHWVAIDSIYFHFVTRNGMPNTSCFHIKQVSSWEMTYFSITKLHYNKLISEVPTISLYCITILHTKQVNAPSGACTQQSHTSVSIPPPHPTSNIFIPCRGRELCHCVESIRPVLRRPSRTKGTL